MKEGILNKLLKQFKFSSKGITLKEKWYLCLPPQVVALTSVLIHNAFIKFYTDIIGLDAKYVGWIYVFYNIWNAINDPLIGVYIDRYKYKENKGRYLYLMRVTAPVMMLSTFAMVLSSPSWPDTVTFLVLLVELFIYDTAQTMYSCAYGPYSLVVAPSKEERIDIGVLGNFISNFLSFFITLIPTLLLVGNSNRAIVVPMFSLVIFLNCIVYWYSLRNLKENKEMYEHIKANESKIGLKNLWIDIKPFVCSRAFLCLVIYSVVARGAMAFYFTPFLYYMDDVLVLTGVVATVVDVVAHTSVLVLMPIIGNVVKKIGGKNSILLSIIPAILGFGGLIFANSVVAGVICYFCIVLAKDFGGLAGGLITTAMIYDNERKTGIRKMGLFGGIFAICTVAFNGVHTVIFSNVISAFGYDGTLAVQSAEAIMGIRIGTGLIPLICFIIGVGVMAFCPINKKVEKELFEFGEKQSNRVVIENK